MRALWNRLNAEWCKAMHPSPMWPIHGYYRCPTCMRAYAVRWSEGEAERGAGHLRPHDLRQQVVAFGAR